MSTILKHFIELFPGGRPAATIRKFPYPYRSSVAISNDCEFLTWEALLDISRLISGPKGLGIPVAHSLFFFTTHKLCHSSFSYFDGVSERVNPYAPQIREMIQAGYIDTIHAYGDFDEGGFERKLAERVLSECRAYNLKFEVFTNHGSRHNTQNIGYTSLPSDFWQGDNPAHPSYHLDIAKQLGVKYIWPDSVAAVAAPYEPVPLLYREKTRDGSEMTFFKRYRGLAGKAAPNISSLPEQMIREDLDRLVEDGLPCFYYQHFGVWTKNPDGTFEANRPPYFTPEGLRVMEYLAELYHDGKCWVVTSSRLVKYLDVRDTIVFETKKDSILITDPSNQFTASDLSGITFNIASPKITRLIWRDGLGNETTLPSRQIFDEKNRQYCLGVPCEPLGAFEW